MRPGFLVRRAGGARQPDEVHVKDAVAARFQKILDIAHTKMMQEMEALAEKRDFQGAAAAQKAVQEMEALAEELRLARAAAARYQVRAAVVVEIVLRHSFVNHNEILHLLPVARQVRTATAPYEERAFTLFEEIIKGTAIEQAMFDYSIEQASDSDESIEVSNSRFQAITIKRVRRTLWGDYWRNCTRQRKERSRRIDAAIAGGHLSGNLKEAVV